MQHLTGGWKEEPQHTSPKHMRFVGNRRDVQKERIVETFDFQSLYVTLMFLCFLQKQKAGIRIGTYFLAAHFLFLILAPLT